MNEDATRMPGPGNALPRRRLLLKYTGFVFVASAVVLGASWFLASWIVWREQRQLVAEAQVLRVRTASDRIRNFLQDTEGRLRFLVSAPWLAHFAERERLFRGIVSTRFTRS